MNHVFSSDKKSAMRAACRVVVTGATSQIGRYLLPRLIQAGYEVVAVSRQQKLKEKSDCAHVITWIQGDITSNCFVWPEVDIWIHLAPLNLIPFLLPGFVHAGGRRIVCFGTTSRYSKAASANPKEQEFAAKQIKSETLLTEQCVQSGVFWTLFRPTLIYGCGLDRNITVIARVIRRFGAFPLFGAASGLRQPVHADDLASACVAVLNESKAFNQAYDLTGAEILTYRQMVTRVFESLGRPPRFVSIPLWGFDVLMRLVAKIPRFKDFNIEMAKRMNDNLVFDCSAAREDFGYSPRKFEPVWTDGTNDR